MELRLVPKTEEPEQQAVRSHLRRSLSDRARAALGVFLAETAAACRETPRLLTGPAAAGVWVPGVVATEPPPLPAALPVDGLVAVRLDVEDDRRGRSVAVVPPPTHLLSDGADDRWPALVTAARLLHEHAPQDAAGRRLPPHRDPDEGRERRDLAQTLTWGGRPRPPVSPLDSRAWRLDGPATLDDALRRQGLRVRHLR
jgi:hypothetical protein